MSKQDSLNQLRAKFTRGNYSYQKPFSRGSPEKIYIVDHGYDHYRAYAIVKLESQERLALYTFNELTAGIITG